MIPAVEVKGAIPFGMALQLAPWQAYLMALCGSFFVVCFLAFFTHWFYVECKKHGFLKNIFSIILIGTIFFIPTFLTYFLNSSFYEKPPSFSIETQNRNIIVIY